MSNLITVVLPVHNVERTLEGDVARILDALHWRSSRLELIIVDDGSTDET